jgi:hypothetical protein
MRLTWISVGLISSMLLSSAPVTAQTGNPYMDRVWDTWNDVGELTRLGRACDENGPGSRACQEALSFLPSFCRKDPNSYECKSYKYNTAVGGSYIRGNTAIMEQIGESIRLDKACQAAGPRSRACQEFASFMKGMEAQTALMEKQIAVWDGQLKVETIRNQVMSSDRAREFRNAQSVARQSAQAYLTYANQSRARGDTAAASKWQSKADAAIRFANQ